MHRSLIMLISALAILAGACAVATDDASVEPEAAVTSPAATSIPLPQPTALPQAEPTESTPPVPTEPAPPATTEPTPVPTGAPIIPAADVVPIIWEPCGLDECGQFSVPLDYDNPDGPRVTLPVSRVLARVPEQRIGSLLLNFGGPGVAATDYLGGYRDLFPPGVRDRFDIVAWDPRGSSGQTELTCPEPESAGELYDADDGFADDVELEEARRIDYTACTAVTGLLDNLGSVPTVHDMDLLRRALGDDQLNYLGYSYGTQLGWMYATMYPENARALVLDAPVEPGTRGPDAWLRQLENFDRQLERLDRLCSETTQCRVYDEGIIATFDRLRSELQESPVPGAGGVPFTDADLVAAVLQSLYSIPTIGGPYLSAAFERLDSGQPDLLESLVESGGYDGYFAITCADDDGIESLSELEAHIAARFDRGDAFEAYPDVVLCDQWPAESIPIPPMDTSRSPAILVFANTDDPATPFEGALSLMEALADAVLVTVQSGGHGVVAFNTCVDEIFATYLIDLELPPLGMRCYEDGARLGLGFAAATDARPGIEVVRVDAGSYGAAAGIEVGDILVRVDNTDITAPGDIPLFELGADVVFVATRQGATLEFNVKTLRAPWTS